MSRRIRSAAARRTRGRWLVVGALAVGGAALLLSRACCTDFAETWRQARTAAPKPEQDLLEGRWSGTWRSETRDDQDELRCVVRKLSADEYQAQFSATYFRILTFNSTVVLTVERRPGEWRFRGKTDLGFMAGGEYTYEGHADGKAFFSTYTSQYDRGVFEMKRVAPDSPAPRTNPS